MSDGHDLPGFDHDHELLGGDLISEDIEGLEMFTLRSVGIDIGSSTSHLVFSKLTLRREGAAFSAKFRVTDREVLYKSKIMLTPYITGTLIDTDRVTQFIHQAYAEAGFTPDEIDTGAVVITGEALKKENAKPIAEFFSADSGKFICASAGPNHEAILAAHGCGAVALSKDNDSTVLNIDCGGGTAKFSVVQNGVVTQTCAVEVGARLIAFDENEVVIRIEEPAKKLMKEAGFQVDLGDRITEDSRDKFAHVMARVLFEIARGGPHSELTKSLLLTDPISGFNDFQGISRIIFSGGVSEYVYQHESATYGDIGPQFGKAIREQLQKVGRPDL